MDIGTRLLEDAYQILYPGTKAVSDTKFSPIYDTNQLVVVNPTPLLLRRELVTIKCGNVGSFWQYYNKQTQCGQLLVENDAFAQAEAGVVIDMQNTRSCTLASAVLKLHIKDGRIVSLRDIKLDRELIPHGQTGGFILYEDQPANWDAWDVDVFHLEKFIRLEFSDLTVVEQGPMRASVKAQVNFGGSKLQVTVSISRNRRSNRHADSCETRSLSIASRVNSRYV
jgi:alpha-mannosidase